MAKYIFTKDYTATPAASDTYSPNKPTQPKLFKAGIIVDATKINTSGIGVVERLVTSDGYDITDSGAQLNTGLGKYITNKQTSLMKSAPVTAGTPMGSEVVSVLPKGTILDIQSKGSGGTGIVASPYLVLIDGTYISGYDADPYNGSTAINYVTSLSEKLKPYMIYGSLGAASAIGYALYKGKSVWKYALWGAASSLAIVFVGEKIREKYYLPKSGTV